MQKITPIFAVGCVVIRADKVLLIQRHDDEDILPGLWELPSGKRELGETSEQAAVRELREETGLAGDVLMPCHVFEYQVVKGNEIRDTTQINYIMRVTSDAVQLSSEHQAYQWVRFGDIDEVPVSENVRGAIRAASKLTALIS